MSVASPKARVVVMLVSGLSYLSALPMPALLFSGHPPVMGITTLLWGWWGVLTGDVPWFANLLYFLALGLVFLRFYKSAQLLSALALTFGCSSLYVRQWFFNEAGGTPVIGLGLAFYLWMASFALLLVGSIGLYWLNLQTAADLASRSGNPREQDKLPGPTAPPVIHQLGSEKNPKR